MLRYTLLSLSCLLGLSSSTFGNIYVWEGDPNDCTIDHQDNTITINEPGTYGFRAFDPNDPNDPNDVLSIQNIDVDPNVAGNVTVTIAWDENGGNGAADLWTGNLTHATYDVYLAGLEISGSIATTDDFICDNITGTVDIDGDIGGTAPGNKFFVRNATGAIIVHGKLRAYTTLQAETLGDVEIGSHPTQGDIAIKNDYAGTLTIHPSMYGDIRIGERDGGGNVTTASNLIGTLNFGGSLLGDVDITDDLATDEGVSGRILVDLHISGGHILVADAVTQTDPNLPAIHVQGDILGSAGSDPVIELGGELDGIIAIEGSLNDVSSGPDIQVASIDTEHLGAIAIDYDGWDLDDTWDPNAIVRVGTEYEYTDYSENTPSLHIWEINECKGDMNNDGMVDGYDDDPFDDALNDPGQYASDYPGLLGSIVWHGDMDCDDDLDAYDQEPFDYFIAEGCTNCTSECQYEACVADIDENGEVGHTDLGILLAAWDSQPGDPHWNENADLDGDDYVGHADLGWLLAEWGNPCDCYDGRDGGGGEGPGGQGARVWVEPYDTNGFTNGGFAGESDHFVFDLVIEITEPANDWTTSGVVARAENGATFRLAPGPTDPDQYASFVSAPRVLDGGPPPNNSGATVAGAYLPADSDYDFASRIINLSWFDKVDSKDGPAAVMRLVIDVSAVPGADTSGGLGSVYFSQTGPALPADIKVVDFRSATGSRCDAGALTGHDGEFFVKAD